MLGLFLPLLFPLGIPFLLICKRWYCVFRGLVWILAQEYVFPHFLFFHLTLVRGHFLVLRGCFQLADRPRFLSVQQLLPLGFLIPLGTIHAFLLQEFVLILALFAPLPLLVLILGSKLILFAVRRRPSPFLAFFLGK